MEAPAFLQWHRVILNKPRIKHCEEEGTRTHDTPTSRHSHWNTGEDVATVSSMVHISHSRDPVITLWGPRSAALKAVVYKILMQLLQALPRQKLRRHWSDEKLKKGNCDICLFPTHRYPAHINPQMILLVWLAQSSALRLRQQWAGWAGQELLLWLPFLGSLSQPRKTVSLSCTLDRRRGKREKEREREEGYKESEWGRTGRQR